MRSTDPLPVLRVDTADRVHLSLSLADTLTPSSLLVDAKSTEFHPSLSLDVTVGAAMWIDEETAPCPRDHSLGLIGLMPDAAGSSCCPSKLFSAHVGAVLNEELRDIHMHHSSRPFPWPTRRRSTR